MPPAPLKLYAIFALLFILRVVQAGGQGSGRISKRPRLARPVSHYIKLFLGQRFNRNETGSVLPELSGHKRHLCTSVCQSLIQKNTGRSGQNLE